MKIGFFIIIFISNWNGLQSNEVKGEDVESCTSTKICYNTVTSRMTAEWGGLNMVGIASRGSSLTAQPGEKGEPGLKGEKGERGRGQRGPRGEKGDPATIDLNDIKEEISGALSQNNSMQNEEFANLQDRVARLEVMFERLFNLSAEPGEIPENQPTVIVPIPKFNRTGWNRAPNGYDYYVSETVDFDEARNLCVAKGSRLATVGIRDVATKQFILEKMLKNRRGSVWIGLNDIEDEAEWMWLDGVKSTLFNTDWDVTEPDDDGQNQDCGYMNAVNGKLQDYRCDWNYNMRALCESSTISLTGDRPTAIIPVSSGDIDTMGWVLAPNGYKYFISGEVNFEEAVKFCILKRASLAVHGIRNLIVKEFLVRELIGQRETSVWVGLTDTDSEAEWVWMDGAKSTSFHTDWKEGEPNDSGQREDCAYVGWSSGKLYDYRCDWDYRALCEMTPENGVEAAMPTDPPGQIDIMSWVTAPNGYKYFISGEVDFDQAKKFCISKGANLAVEGLRDLKVKQFLLEKFVSKRGKSVWIGLTDMETEADWKWLDGVKSTSYNTDWNEAEPNDSGQREDCAYMGYTSGTLFDYRCDWDFRALCEMAPEGSIPGTKPTVAAPPAGTIDIMDWVHAPNGYEYFISGEVNYDEAKKFCILRNSSLAVVGIRDYATKDYLVSKFIGKRMRAVWIGLTDAEVEDQWTWSDGVAATKVNTDWADNQPSTNNRRENCAYVSSSSGKISDYRCGWDYRALCERRIHSS